MSGAARWVARIVLVAVLDAVALVLAAAVLPGVEVDSAGASLLAVAAVGLVNAVLWPLLARVALRLFLLTAGLLALALNGAVLLAASALVSGFDVRGLGSAVVVVLWLAVVNVAASGVLSIDDDASYYRGVIRRGARRIASPEPTDSPGTFMLEIDGLSEATLQRAMAEGRMPTVARWLEEGSHRLIGWECDLSSQTAASQAGLLMGDNTDVPAFRWFEKDRGRVVVSSSREDCAEIERRLTSGHGLLAPDGVSVGNLLSGEAARSLFTFSTASLRARPRPDLLAFFANPYAMSRTLILMLRDAVRERVAAGRQRRRDQQPRIQRTRKYALIRAGTVVALRDLSAATLVGNIFAGTRVAYATFFGYDEVAHHSGIERPDAMAVLTDIDRHFARLEQAASLAPRPYRFVVLSDHGQSQGATFLQRYGLSLEDLVDGALHDSHTVGVMEPAEEARTGVGAALTEVASQGSNTAQLADRAAPGPGTVETTDAGAVVLASGNLGLIYLTDRPSRLDREEIDALHPDLLPALVGHPGIAFVRVRSATEGTVVLGAGGSHRLADGHVEGVDPLATFGPNAPAHLLRHDGFEHTPDVLVNSLYDPATGEVAAFEELVGSHGGLGGPQAHPFAVVPVEFPVPEEPIVGASAMHDALKSWTRAG